jgi:D-alanyl-D-alanine carboxypeptidase
VRSLAHGVLVAALSFAGSLSAAQSGESRGSPPSPPGPGGRALPRCLGNVPFSGVTYAGDAGARIREPGPADLSGQLPAGLVSRLNTTLDGILSASGAPAVSAAIGVPGRGRWTASRGLASAVPPVPLEPEPYFWWASVGKVFTVASVLILIDEGKLKSSDRLSRWYPEFPNANEITIQQMMTHTSGIGSFPDPGADPRTSMAYVSPDTIVSRAVARGGVVACPGERWSYSNTAMVMLGRIIERIEGKPFHAVVTEKIIKRLSLSHMISAPPMPNIPGLPREHIKGEPQPPYNAMPFSAGNIVATAEDMVTFWQAFMAGRVVPLGTVRESLRTLYPFDGGSLSQAFRADAFFGRGIMLFETYPDAKGEPHVWIGHVGGGVGSTALVLYEVGSGIFLAIAFNGQADRVAAAESLLSVTRRELGL